MQHDGMTMQAFIEATRDARWATIEDLQARLDAIDFWTEDFKAASVDANKKTWIRREIRRITDADGWPVFASVSTIDPLTNDESRVYKQEAIFDRDDYLQVVQYHQRRAVYHEKMAAGYAGRAKLRLGMQIPMDLGGMRAGEEVRR